jgi:hypothetical protein
VLFSHCVRGVSTQTEAVLATLGNSGGSKGGRDPRGRRAHSLTEYFKQLTPRETQRRASGAERGERSDGKEGVGRDSKELERATLSVATNSERTSSLSGAVSPQTSDESQTDPNSV